MSDGRFYVYDRGTGQNHELGSADVSVLILGLEALSLDRVYGSEYRTEILDLLKRLKPLQ